MTQGINCNLATDPGETENLADREAARTVEMASRLEKIRQGRQ